MTRQANTHPTKGQSMRVKLSTFCVLAGLSLALTASPALAVRGHVFENTFGSPGSAAGQLSEPEALAVSESSHDVYVADRGNDRVDLFTAAGEFVEAWGWGVKDGKEEFEVCTSGCRAGNPGTETPGLAGAQHQPNRIAVDNACVLNGLNEASKPVSCKEFDPSDGDVYVETGEFQHQVVEKFTAAGVLLGVIKGPPAPEPGAFAGGVEGLAVDVAGRLFVLEGQDGGSGHEGVDWYTAALVNQFARFTAVQGPDELGLAVDASDDLFVREGYLGATVVEFSPAGSSVVAVNPEFNGVAVELSSGDVYVSDASEVKRFGPLRAGVSPLLEAFGSGDLESKREPCRDQSEGGTEALCRGGVAVDSSSGAVFVSVGSEGRVVRFVLEPPGPPEVTDESVSEVTSSSGRLSGEVNPRSEPFEPATAWSFQYLSERQYQENVSNGVEPFTNAKEAPEPAGTLAPNYELDPVSERLAGLSPGTSYRYRIEAHNEALGTPRTSFGETRTFTTEPVGESGLLDGRGWELVSPPDKLGALLEPLSRFAIFAVQAAAAGGGVTYVATAPTGGTPAGNAGFTQVLSSRDGSSGGWVTRDLVLPHSQATGVSEHPEWPLFSEDLARAVVQPLGPFEEGLSPLGSEQTAYSYDDFQGGGASGEACTSGCYTPLVTALNAPGVEFGIQEEGPKSSSDLCPPNPFCGPQFVAASPDLEHVVVHSRVALTPSTEGLSGHEKLFEVSEGRLTFVGEGEVGDGRTGEVSMVSAGRHTVSVDGSRVVFKGTAAGKSGLLLRDTVTGEVVRLAAGAVFLGASSDDSRVFFTGATGALEMCEIMPGESGELQCNESGKPLDLTPGASVLAPLAGVSEDGSSVYFVSTSVLSGTEKDPGGEAATNGQPNLYVYHEGSTRLVAVLSGTARVSPDGGWLAFQSTRSLTGYDNTDAATGTPDGEVYLYHAPTAGQPASVVCASCDPTGARPTGPASVPGWTTRQYQSRYLSNGGRLFFDSPDQLVPQDTNKVGDVYEYEPAVGAGGGTQSSAGGLEPGEAPPSDSCTTASLVYHVSSGGCVDLVSSGTSSEPSSFLDASESGDDVFFLTTAQISKRDTDTSFDVYDASVGGSEPEPPKPVECQGDACQTPVAPPENLTPGSLTFTGPGNLLYTPPAGKPAVNKKTVRCKAGFVRRTVKHKSECVRKSKPKRRRRAKS